VFGSGGGVGREGNGRALVAVAARAARVRGAMDEDKVWGLLKGREVLVVGHSDAGAAAHMWTMQTLALLSWPYFCRTVHSLALGPSLFADAQLACRVRETYGIAFENVFTEHDPMRRAHPHLQPLRREVFSAFVALPATLVCAVPLFLLVSVSVFVSVPG
jgi:hypothetical protein